MLTTTSTPMTDFSHVDRLNPHHVPVDKGFAKFAKILEWAASRFEVSNLAAADADRFTFYIKKNQSDKRGLQLKIARYGDRCVVLLFEATNARDAGEIVIDTMSFESVLPQLEKMEKELFDVLSEINKVPSIGR